MHSHHLLNAIFNKNFSRALALIKEKADVNSLQERGNPRPYLLLAIANWFHQAPKLSMQLIKSLCEVGANIRATDNSGLSVFIAAIMLTGHSELIDYLQQQGIGFEHPIFAAAWRGDQVEFERLIEYYNQQDSYSNSILHYAVAGGHLDFVKYLFEKNLPSISVSAINKGNVTPSLIASRLDHLEILQFLLEKGAQLSEKTNHGNTALHLAASSGAMRVARWLIENKQCKLSVGNSNGSTPLFYAVQSRNLEMVSHFLEHGSEVTRKNKQGQDAVYVAAQYGDLPILELLLEKGGNLQMLTKKQETILHAAAIYGCLEMVRYIVKKDYRLVSCKTSLGETPISWAAAAGHLEIVKYLLSIPGANFYDRSHDGKSLIHWFAQSGNLLGIQWVLKESKGKISVLEHASDQLRTTPLHLAIFHRHLDMIKWIIETHPDVQTFLSSNDCDFIYYQRAIAYNCNEEFKCLVAYAEKSRSTEGLSILFNASIHKAIECRNIDIVTWLINEKKIDIFQVIGPRFAERGLTFLSYAVQLLNRMQDPNEHAEEKMQLQHIIFLLLQAGAGIKTDFSNIEISFSQESSWIVLIGATGLTHVPKGIHNLAELEQAIQDGVEFNLPALKRAVDRRLQEYPNDVELIETSKLLTKYQCGKERYPNLSLKALYGLANHGFSLFFVAKRPLDIFPQEILINIACQATKLNLFQVVEVFNAVIENIFKDSVETANQLKLGMKS